jgi:cyclohexanecarboxyl-CoA dehydrogenase
MLDFSFTPAEEEYRASLRELALRDLLPVYRRWDAQQAYPYEQVKRVLRFAAGFWRGRESERTLIVSGITAEEVARGDFNVVLPSLGPALFGQFLTEASDALRERWMPGLVSGEHVIALGLTEAGAGSDMAGIRSTGERRGDGFILNGEKNSVSFLNADVFYLFVRTDPESTGWRGLSAFLVPRDAPGLSFERVEDLGCRSVPRGIVRMQDVEVPMDWLVGTPGNAFPMIAHFFDINRAIISLKCVGAAQQTVDETIEYTKTREQFGAPLATFQGVAFPVAEAATLLELARWHSYRVLWLRQRGQPCMKEGAMIKWWAPKVAAEVIHQCLLLHGHYGYSRDLPIEQRLRDVIGWQIGDGAENIMKLIVARELFGKGMAPR